MTELEYLESILYQVTDISGKLDQISTFLGLISSSVNTLLHVVIAYTIFQATKDVFKL